VCPADQVDAEILQKLGHHIFSKGIADPSLVFSPTLNVWVRVRPKEGIEVWAKSAMHADDLIVDNSADRHRIKNVEEVFPDLEVVSALTLIKRVLHSS
jgi:hypothetical protein